MANLNLTGKYFAVFGLGNIGRPITERLLEANAAVASFSTGRLREDVEVLIEKYEGLTRETVDVRDLSYVQASGMSFDKDDITFDGIIYAVGSCAPGGFTNEVSDLLGTHKSFEKLNEAMELQCRGLLNVYRTFYKLLIERGHFVTIGARVADADHEQVPLGINLWPYAAAKAAQKKLVQGFRHQEGKGRMFHWIAPGAVDCPFHEKTPAHAKVPVSAVVDAVMEALQAHLHIDKVVIPSPL